MGVGRLRRVPLREVWKHEALDFTRWLEDNLDVVADITGIDLTNITREQAAGAFSVDLVAQDDAGNNVVIENQLERSDHDHLGKLITYITAFEAKAAVWIVSDPRPEHVAAITWLNQATPASFYLLKVEAVRIGDSLPAPLVTLIVGPSDEGRAVGETKHELAGQRALFHEFWTRLKERASEKTQLHDETLPGYGTWMSAGTGQRGVFLSYIVRLQDARVELYIDVGDRNQNRAIFDQLIASRIQIEETLGRELLWDSREGRQACKVELPLSVGGYRDRYRWPQVQDAMIGAMIRFEQAFRPHLDRITG